MNKKKLMGVLIVGAMAISAVGGTFAWFTSNESIEDSFVTGGLVDSEDDEGIKILVEKEDKDYVILPGVENKYIVSFESKSNYKEFIRVKVKGQWDDNVNKSNEEKLLKDEYIIINLEEGNIGSDDGKWYKHHDESTNEDYYYYMGTIDSVSNNKTSELVKSIKLSEEADNAYKNKNYKINIEVEAIQADGDAYKTWSGINEDIIKELSKYNNTSVE